ncbi:hypothetical protein Y032_0032g2582 [Ancylostoma ceylanicum]|uniref:Uncharacterized protein n=1 Tax=Ancylostoma ceylanicum TaxID=53326 RepID=A0A016UPZ4_9BILA|nr:hypothetical protein Y032_0032g2582 [Ancylostoma ceylanicum]
MNPQISVLDPEFPVAVLNFWCHNSEDSRSTPVPKGTQTGIHETGKDTGSGVITSRAQSAGGTRWIRDVEEIEKAESEDQKKDKTEVLKKSLKRRLTTVVGADSDASIFGLADAYEKVDAVVDQSDEFGKAVAEHLKKTAAMKPSEAKRRRRAEQPFPRGGYPTGTMIPAGSLHQFPTFSQAVQQFPGPQSQ